HAAPCRRVFFRLPMHPQRTSQAEERFGLSVPPTGPLAELLPEHELLLGGLLGGGLPTGGHAPPRHHEPRERASDGWACAPQPVPHAGIVANAGLKACATAILGPEVPSAFSSSRGD